MNRTLVIAAVLALAVCLPGAFAHSRKEGPCDKGYTHSGNVTGAEVKLGGLNAYVAFPALKHRGSSQTRLATVILIADIYGWKQASTRIWADKLAKKGFLVVLPDFFRGDPWTETRNREAEFAGWIAKFPEQQVLKDIAAVQKELKKGVRGYKAGKFGAEGFCWGGLHSALVAGAKPAVSAAIVYHGSRLDLDDIKAIKRPVYFLKADPELDANFPPALYSQTEAIFRAKRAQGIDARLKYYPGMRHGFTVRGDPNNATIVKAAEDAFNKGAEFLAKYLK